MFNTLKWRMREWKRELCLLPRKSRRCVVALYYYHTIAQRKHCIYVKFPKTCRLGNQMFMTAFGEALRERTGFTVLYYTKFTDYYLEAIDPWIFSRFRVLTFDIPMQTVIEEPTLLSDDSDEQIKEALSKGNVMISGFFEDIRLLDISNLRKVHPRPSWVTNVLKRQYGDLSDAVSIHVRRGDFVGIGVSLGIEYYLKAMSLFPQGTTFIVISDDLDWCKENFKNCGARVIFASHCAKPDDTLYLDLFLPSLCLCGNILSGSSFSWWGSALNDNPHVIRVMPQPWWNDADKHLYFTDTIIIETKNLLSL